MKDRLEKIDAQVASKLGVDVKIVRKVRESQELFLKKVIGSFDPKSEEKIQINFSFLGKFVTNNKVHHLKVWKLMQQIKINKDE